MSLPSLPFAVGASCKIPFPCKHVVYFDDKKTRQNVGAREIVLMYQEAGHPVPAHFQYMLNKSQMKLSIGGAGKATIWQMSPVNTVLDQEVEKKKYLE